MRSQKSLANRAFAYESAGEHIKALAIWKKPHSKSIYPGAYVRAAEIARSFGLKKELRRLLNFIEPSEIVNEFGLELGEALIIELVRSRPCKEFDFPTTIKIDAARWESGTSIDDLAPNNFCEYNLKDLPSSSLSLIEAKYPLSLKEKLSRRSFNNRFFRTRHETHCIDLHDVRAVIGSSGFVSSGFLFIDEFRSTYPQIASCDDDPLIFAIKDRMGLCVSLQPTQKLVGGFWCAIKYGKEFGHFTSTLLTRMKYFEDHPKWGDWPLIVSDKLTKVEVEYLGTLFPGIPISAFPESESIHFDTLVVAPTTVFSPATIQSYSKEPDWMFIDLSEFKWLYGRMRSVTKTKDSEYKKVAISRKKYSRRKCLNARLWENLAQSNGFTIIDPADLTAIEQIDLFIHASDIVGEVGSWIYLSGLNPSATLTLLNSDADYQVWNEISQLDKIRNAPIQIIRGKREGTKNLLSNPSNVHAPWVLTKRNFLQIRMGFRKIRSKNLGSTS